MVEISSNQLIIGFLTIAFLTTTTLLLVSAYRHVVYLIQKRLVPVPAAPSRRRRVEDDEDGDEGDYVDEPELDQVRTRKRGGQRR